MVPETAVPETGKTVPVADWVSVPDLLADPFPIYHRLRAESPVVWVPVLNRYLVLDHEGCHAVEQNQEIFTAAVKGGGATMIRALGGTPMLRKDDPEHAVDRAAVNPALRPRALKESWLSIFERNAMQYVDALREMGPEDANLDRDYAAPVAAQNLRDLLGITSASVDDIRRWSSAFVAATGNLLDDPELWRRAEEASDEVESALDDLIPWYRANPGPSITSALVQSGLDREAIAANVKLSISGGMNEPQHAITTSVYGLSTHPDQRARVVAEPSLWPAVFDEAVRWTAPIGMYPRETTQNTVLRGYALPAGAAVGVVVGAANRDPSFVENPDDFDVFRPKVPHLAFGSGVHLCAGHWAARISIGQVAVPVLYREFPGLRVDPRRETTFEGWVFRGATQLPVTWDN